MRFQFDAIVADDCMSGSSGFRVKFFNAAALLLGVEAVKFKTLPKREQHRLLSDLTGSGEDTPAIVGKFKADAEGFLSLVDVDL